MSYRCQKTGKAIGPGIREFKVVTERRVKQYPIEIKRGSRKGEYEMREGWEIVTELTVGPEAYEEMTGEVAGNLTNKNMAISPDAVTREKDARPYEPWNKRPKRKYNSRRPKVDKVQKFKPKKG